MAIADPYILFIYFLPFEEKNNGSCAPMHIKAEGGKKRGPVGEQNKKQQKIKTDAHDACLKHFG